MELRNKWVVVTGGAGFVGSHVVDRLVAAGNDVATIDNFCPMDEKHGFYPTNMYGASKLAGEYYTLSYYVEGYQCRAGRVYRVGAIRGASRWSGPARVGQAA